MSVARGCLGSLRAADIDSVKSRIVPIGRLYLRFFFAAAGVVGMMRGERGACLSDLLAPRQARRSRPCRSWPFVTNWTSGKAAPLFRKQVCASEPLLLKHRASLALPPSDMRSRDS